ncbi:hypothetical protein AVEN_108216-1 [Araneus ventricosus]|uniref:Uncharacterized protein n=1 Tax=Araneus ventricosus TaxID=182803 RepID=A0A4Y2I3A7_ARAVE|nr:hypothetical protein AVEN_108216-1 [Araneus ventricosus]
MSTWMRSRRISKRVLTSFVGMIMVWGLVTSTSMTERTSCGKSGLCPVMAIRILPSVSDERYDHHHSDSPDASSERKVTPFLVTLRMNKNELELRRNGVPMNDIVKKVIYI